jgi:tRNA U38,U39,U40 pseudouridine synthase TruA
MDIDKNKRLLFRKMIAFAIAVVRGVASKENLEASFLGDKSDMPMAPALGLMLERVS